MARREELISELAILQEEEAKLKELRPHDFYRPLPGGQQRFWTSTLREKWIFGANQSGKTTTSINYVIKKLKEKPGSRWYIGASSMDRSRKVIQKKFWEWVNKDDVDNGSTYRTDDGFKNDCCLFNNGSICFFLSYEMEQDKWASDTLDGIDFDEEPPWHIFTEGQKRIIAKNGEIIGAMTALKSYTRLVERVYLSGDSNIGLFVVPLHENHVKFGGVYTDDRIHEIIEQTPESERNSRIYGMPTYRTGLVYDQWQDKYPWVIPMNKEFAIPEQWTRYCAIDPHASLPQAAIMIAVSPEKRMYQYKELWVKALIPDFAKLLRAAQSPVPFEVVLIDNHYSTQKNAESGKNIKQLLVEYGDIMTVGGCDDVVARIDMLKAWDKLNPATGLPMLQVFESCVRTRWERKRYEWESPISERISERRDSAQKPKAKNGHLMNAAEYLAAYGGKDGLEYVPPRLSDRMQAKVIMHQAMVEQDEIRDNVEEESYMDSCSAIYM